MCGRCPSAGCIVDALSGRNCKINALTNLPAPVPRLTAVLRHQHVTSPSSLHKTALAAPRARGVVEDTDHMGRVLRIANAPRGAEINVAGIDPPHLWTLPGVEGQASSMARVSGVGPPDATDPRP